MAALLSVELGISQIAMKRLELLHSKVDKAELLDEAGAILLSRIRARYLEEVDPDGKPWTPSFAGTARRKKGGTGTLFDTGNLFHSIGVTGEGDSERRVAAVGVPYADTMQSGGTFFDHPFPGRRFIGANQSDKKLVEGRLKKSIDRMLAEGL